MRPKGQDLPKAALASAGSNLRVAKAWKLPGLTEAKAVLDGGFSKA
jgi:hypothetical protein